MDVHGEDEVSLQGLRHRHLLSILDKSPRSEETSTWLMRDRIIATDFGVLVVVSRCVSRVQISEREKWALHSDACQCVSPVGIASLVCGRLSPGI